MYSKGHRKFGLRRRRGFVMKRVGIGLAALALVATGCSSTGNSSSPTSSSDTPTSGSSPVDSGTGSSSPTDSGSPTSDTPEPTISLSNTGPVSIAWWGADARNQAMTKVATAFGSENGVKVQTQPAEFAAYWDRLTIETAASNLPCVVATNTRTNGQYEDKGAFIPLDDLVNAGVLDASGISETALNGQRNADGKLYTIPHGFWFEAIVYNETMMAKYDVPVPEQGWTWEQYVDWARTAQPKLPAGVYALNDRSNQAVQFQAYVTEHGQTLFAPSNTEVGFTQETLANWFSMWQQARSEGLTPTAELSVQDQQAPAAAALIATGNVLVSTKSDNYLGDFQTGLDAINGGTLRLLGLPTGGAPQAIGSNSWSISSNCEDVKDAVAFINYYINNPSATATMGGQSGLPVNGSIMELEASSPDVDQATKDRIALLQSLEANGAKTDVWPANSSLLETQLKSIAEQVWFGKVSPDEAAAFLIEQVNDALSNNG